ncbi:TPA: hypothetical protein ACWWDF_002809 [Enterococcus faecium]
MKKKLVWLVFPLLVLTLAACSLGKSDKAFGYTYEEYNKLLSNNTGLSEKVLAVTKYEYNDQDFYLLAFNDDFKGGIAKTGYYKVDSEYIEKHKTNESEDETKYFGYEKPAIDKVIEKYKVTDDHKFEKADSE